MLLYWNLTLKLQIIPQLLSNLNPRFSSCPLGTHCSVLQRALTCLTTATSQSTLSHPSSPCYHFTFQRTLWQGGHLCEDSSVLWFFFFPRVSTCLLFRWELLTGFVTTLSGVDLAPLQFPPHPLGPLRSWAHTTCPWVFVFLEIWKYLLLFLAKKPKTPKLSK